MSRQVKAVCNRRWAAACTAILMVALTFVGCQSTGGSGGGGTSSKRGTLYLKVFNNDTKSAGTPTPVVVKLDGKEIVNRNISMGEKSYDGQYQIRLPQGKHTIEATVGQGNKFTSRAFKLGGTAFIQVYVTQDEKWHLTASSKRSLWRAVIQKTRAARGANSNPALWMIIPAPTPLPATRDNGSATQPANRGKLPIGNATERGK